MHNNVSHHQTWFSATHKTANNKGKKVKLSLARFWCHYDGQWVFTHDSHIHRDPRLALCGDHKRTEEATCVFFILFFYDYVIHLLCVIYILICQVLQNRSHFSRCGYACARSRGRGSAGCT